MATVAEKLLTAEEFAKRPDPGYPTELIRGRIVDLPSPGFDHGRICGRICRIVGNYVDEHELGEVLTNDTGVITERGPDSVRGPDVSFYSHERVPKGSSIKGYAPVAPELVFEVFSPNDRWSKVHVKVGEYLEAGVLLVVVVDPKTKSTFLYGADEANQVLRPDDDFSAPEILGDFRIPVRRFFE